MQEMTNRQTDKPRTRQINTQANMLPTTLN